MALEFCEPTDDLRRMANKLINEHFTHLSVKRVDFVFVQDRDADGIVTAPKSKGKYIWARATVVTGLKAYLATPEESRPTVKEPLEAAKFFVIEVAKPIWESLKDQPKVREALLHHELMHCELNESGNPVLRPHDVEEFNQTVRRYGRWKDDVQLFVEASAEQMPLLKLMEMQAANDSDLFDSIEVEIAGRKQRVSRADLMTWWHQLELQHQEIKNDPIGREFKEMASEPEKWKNVTFEYKGKEVYV